jgi:hypothetical protein
VYFADRSTDGGLGVRLLVEGVITREQMHRATLMVGGVEHLGRMFDRDASIDRDAVELCVELMTDDVLTAVADAPVTGYKLHLYKRHPSGVDRWLPTRVEVVTHLVSDPALLEDGVDVAAGDAPRSRPHLTPPPATGEVKIPTAEHAPAYAATVQLTHDVATEVPLHDTPHDTPRATVNGTVNGTGHGTRHESLHGTPHDASDSAQLPSPPSPTDIEPRSGQDEQHDASADAEPFGAGRLLSLADAVTDVVPVIPSEPPAWHASSTDEDADDATTLPSFASVPPAAFTTLQIPTIAVNGTGHTNGTEHHNGAGQPDSARENPAIRAVVEVLPGSIADEVAEAVRRALAAIDTP